MNIISDLAAEVASDNSGVGARIQLLEEDITVNAVTEDSVANLLPANSIILAVCYRVITAISGGDATAFSIGDATTPARFASGVARAVDTNGVALTHMHGVVSTTATGPTQTAAAAIRLTATGGTPTAPTAGVVRVTVIALTFTSPAVVA